MYSTYQYTDIVDSQFQRRTSQLESFYCREDFSNAVKQYRKARKDAKPSRRRDLERLCHARGVDCDRLIADESLLSTIPTRQEMKDQLLEIFYDLYSCAPSPAAYMERIVRRLAPEFRTDPVRTAILKKFVLGGGTDFGTYDTKAVIAWAVSKMNDQTRERYKAASAAEKLTLAVAQLDDAIFTPERLSVELTHKEILDLMDWRWARIRDEIGKVWQLGIFSDTSNRTRNQLRSFCRNQHIDFGSDDSVKELALKIVNTMETFCKEHTIPAVNCKDFVGSLHTMIDSLRKRKSETITTHQMEFVSDCFWLLMRKTTYTTKNGQEAAAEDLFKTDIKDARRKKQAKEWELLRVCNNLAAGNFKTNNGRTRIFLYQFAIMFSMTIVLAYDDQRDPDRDVVKNLFEDYYCDNMVRFLDSAFADPKFASTQEREPGGEGINLKNFAEAIYVYYLYRTDLELTPGQRIDHAEKAIEMCIDRAKTAPAPANGIRKQDYTSFYEQRMIDKIISVEETALVDRIVANYHISAQSNAQVTQVSDTNTAFGIMRETMDRIEEGDIYAGDTPPDYGSNDEARELTKALIEDIRYESDFKFRWDLAPLLLERYAQAEGFTRIVKHISQRLSAEVESTGERRINLYADMLHILYLHSSEDSPISLEAFKEHLHLTEAALTGSQIVTHTEKLAKLGFDIHRISGKDESSFYLGQQTSQDELLQQIMERIKVRYRYHEEAEKRARHELFTQLLGKDVHHNRKITRTTLIAVLTYHYIAFVQDRSDLISLPDVYEDFTATLNPDLIESRFQPLNEKNILDMFVILSVYLYLIEYGKGDFI